jgi:hypothetical protein
VTRAIHEAAGVPVARSFALAKQALALFHDGDEPVVLRTGDSTIGVVVDVRRILSSFNVRLSALRTTFAPQQRGRPASRRANPLQAAADWGTDLTLVADNMAKTSEERLRQLDAMGAFARNVKRQLPVSR